MEKLRLYAVSSLLRPPTQMGRKKDKRMFYCTLTLPIPPQLLIFNQGEWPKGETRDITLDIFLDSEKIGTMDENTKCFAWDADSLAKRPDGDKIFVEVKMIGTEAQIKQSPVQKTRKSVKLTRKSGKTSPQAKGPADAEDGKNDKVLTDISDNISADLKKMTMIPEDKMNLDNENQSLTDGHVTKTTQKAEKGKPGGKKSSTVAGVTDKKKASPSSSEVKKTRQTQLSFTSMKISPSVAEPEKRQEKAQNGKKSGADLTETDAADQSKTEASSSGQDSMQTETELMEVDENGRCEAQALNESTPQVTDMPSPLPRKPVKQKRRRSEGDKTPEGPTPKKRGTRMRALTSEGATPKSSRGKGALGDISLAENVPAAEEGTKISAVSEGRKTRCVDLSARAPRPSARWGHTMLLTQPSCAVVIGGQGDRQQLSRDSVWTLHTETRKWQSQEIQSEGQKPENRMGHTATYDPTVRCIYIFGGSKNSRWFHDVHVYDVDENKWTLAKVNGKAPTRAYHTATLHRHELWIFGGVYPRPDPNPDGCSNDIHIFSPVMQSWYSPIVQGEKPLARSGHSATLIKDQMVMFGGWDAPFCYNDLFILDMTTVDWCKPDVKGTPPKPRSWHASCALSNSRILIHGGYDGNNALEDSFIFDLGGLTWSQLVVPNTPKARAGHAAVCVPYSHENQEEDEILVFGGGDNDGEFFSDLLLFAVPFNPVVEAE